MSGLTPEADPVTEAALEELLSRPVPEVVDAMRRIRGDIVVLGVAGKMGPSLARLALRASRDAGVARRVIGVARFTDPAIRRDLDAAGVDTIACDLFDRGALDDLPEADNIIYMAGRKFGTGGDAAATWATNAWLPGAVAARFAASRIVALSTGNVYPLTPVGQPGPDEDDPVGPIGEYAQSALARERVLAFFAVRNATPMCVLRLNYAVEPRYGVVRDIVDAILAGVPVPLGMGYVNLIWQRDANAVVLRALEHCTSPPTVINLTGRTTYSVRDIGERCAARLEKHVEFSGVEGPTALLSNAAQSERIFGRPELDLDRIVAHVADWAASGGRSLNKPTHFEQREGRF